MSTKAEKLRKSFFPESALLGNALAAIGELEARVAKLEAALRKSMPSACQATYKGSPDYGKAPCGRCSYCVALAALEPR